MDPERITLLGHSEGTQVALDYAATDSAIHALVLLGFAGENLKSILDWQIFRTLSELAPKLK